MELNPQDCTDCEHRDQCDEAGRLLSEIAWNSEVHDFKKSWLLNLGRMCPRNAHTLPFTIASAAEKVFFEEHRLLTFRELADLNDKLEQAGE